MSYVLEKVVKEQSNGFNLTLEIWQDGDVESPREWDNFGIMVTNHGRYSFGGGKDRSFDHDKYEGWDEVLKHECADGSLDNIIYLPLYLYDHSIQAMSTESFIGRAHHAEWDSGQVGWIYITKEQVRKEYGVKRVTKKVRERALELLKSEVDLYSRYMQGEVYGFTLEDEEKNVHESCGGFYGSGKELVECMKEHVGREYSSLFDELSL